MNIRTRTAFALITAAAALAVVAPASANADSQSPTVGDTITYYGFSDEKFNNSITWFDENNDIDELSTAAKFADINKQGRYYTHFSLTSRSTIQLAGSTVQTNGYFAGCRVFVNGTKVAEDFATGHYAVAAC